MKFLDYYRDKSYNERQVILILKRGPGRYIVSRDGSYKNSNISSKELDELVEITENDGIKLRMTEYPSYHSDKPHKLYYDPDYIHHVTEFYKSDIVDRVVPSLILISMAIYPTENNRILCDFPVETRGWDYDEYRKFMRAIRLDAICVIKKKLEVSIWTESTNAFKETISHLRRLDFRGGKVFKDKK